MGSSGLDRDTWGLQQADRLIRLALGASLVLETGYTATRTGELSPPPFTPVDPDEVEPGLPDEGMEAM